jgi:hypothetical protein
MHKRQKARPPAEDGPKSTHDLFGNPAVPIGPMALRPRIAPGLPLSESDILKKTNSGRGKSQGKSEFERKQIKDYQQRTEMIIRLAEA